MANIKIFDPEQFRKQLDRSETYDMGDPFPSPTDTQRSAYLRLLADDERQGYRDLLVMDEAAIKKIEALLEISPHFGEAIGVVRRAAEVSRRSAKAMRLPPLILLGKAGIGKSHVARLLAKSIGAPFHELSMVNVDDPLGILCGHSVSWRGARPGLITRALVEGHSASPIFYLDEIDKTFSDSHNDPRDFLHAVLDPENAKEGYSDQFLGGAPLRADGILWIMTANSVDDLRPSLLDRALVLDIPIPGFDARSAVIYLCL